MMTITLSLFRQRSRLTKEESRSVLEKDSLSALTKISRSALTALLLLPFTPLVQAQGTYQYDDRDNYRDNYRAGEVVIYEDCNFRGTSRAISIGDYRNMGVVDFNNDTISSIRVPRGLEVTLYQDDRFRGDYARVDRDVACFDRTWNDKVSSLRVVDSGRNARGRDRDDRRYDDKGSRAADRDYRNQRGSDYRNNPRNNARNNNQSRTLDSNVTAKNVSRVVFANRVLQQIDRKKWRMNDSRKGVSQYDETSRDSNSVYLQNSYTAEKIRIDLFANNVTIVKRRGKTNSYPIQNMQASLNRSGQNRPAITQQPNRRIKGRCFAYKAYTNGGEGGVRFHGHDGFERFSKRAHKGRICHDGALTMEINKTQPSTNVVVEIQGKKFRFARNEKEDIYKNTWYRKKVQLIVD